jgi:hypothetical protein
LRLLLDWQQVCATEPKHTIFLTFGVVTPRWS